MKTFEEAAQTVAEEFVLLVQHVVRDDDYRYGVRGERSDERRVDPSREGRRWAPISRTSKRLVRWVLFVTSYYENLSPEEIRVRDIALDLRSAFDRARNMGPDRLAKLLAELRRRHGLPTPRVQ